ncbi:MAG: glycoside hydrolase family 2 protein, partial [Bacteroidota bacterium]|nr:glycoside hydrolase family 2 protein [Bacteroidota bacterium]
VTGTVISEEKGKNDTKWTIRVTNSSGKIAFFIRPQVTVSGREVMPSFWSENYFTLAPSESTMVTVTCPAAQLKGGPAMLRLSAWNVKAKEIKLGLK